jgi:23S rRNA (uracil1939-C5)-methyltransferase
MIARDDGQVVLISGAIPGEVVTARIERVRKGVVFAQVETVEEPSADRREPFTDPRCGGCLYAHIAYPRQLEIKAQVIADAFGRIGRLPLTAPVTVAASRDDGYRMRARLHVRGGRIGFFREGTHDLCDARATRQLLPETCDTLDRLAAGLRAVAAHAVREVEVSENIAATQRAIFLDAGGPIDPGPLAALAATADITGLLAAGHTIAGDPHVTDILAIDGQDLALRRHVLAFFQGNRYLLADLVRQVVGDIQKGATVVDLYAGAGLFAVAAAAVREARVTAVEGDRYGAADLAANATASAVAFEAIHATVETFVARGRPAPDVLIVDPPRTGMSREAVDGALAMRARRVIYVSCDVATLARDARRFVDAGYQLAGVRAFDLFPNTPHVESVVDLRI